MSRGVCVSLGARLKQARRSVGLSQTEFAERCGVSKNGQSNFERDTNTPGGAYLLAVSGMGIDVAWILTGLPAATTTEEAALLHGFRVAPPPARAQALKLLGAPVGGGK